MRDCSSGSEDAEDGSDASGRDAKDFEAVYVEKANNLHAYAASILRGTAVEAQVEDVVQEAIIGLWRKYTATNEVPRSWFAVMMTAVKHRAIDLLRSAPVRHGGRRLDDPDEHREPADLTDFTDFTEDHANQSVRKALDDLPDQQQREVLYRIYYDNEKQADIARDLGLTPGRITQIKQAGLKQLGTQLDDEAGR